MKNCNNCAWFCHSDGKCYGNNYLLYWGEVGATLTTAPEDGRCGSWTFDGLEDWEREDSVLMTMGEVK